MKNKEQFNIHIQWPPSTDKLNHLLMVINLRGIDPPSLDAGMDYICVLGEYLYLDGVQTEMRYPSNHPLQ